MPVDLGEPTTIVLVRHGSTEDTQSGKVRGGDGPGPALTAQGREQVVALAGHLPAGTLITSPALRAVQTASILRASLGLAVPMIDDDWAELRLGDWDGLSYTEIAARWPGQFSSWRASSAVAPPDGESLDDLGLRVSAALERLVKQYPGQTLLVVSHTAPIRSVIARALEAGPAALWRLRLDPASASVIRFWTDGGCEVELRGRPF